MLSNRIYFLRRRVADSVTIFCLRLVGKLNPSKDRYLARRLAEMGREYDPKDCTPNSLIRGTEFEDRI